MNGIDIRECGALTGVAEMLAMKRQLLPIWDSLCADHPIDICESMLESHRLPERVAEVIFTIPRITEKQYIILAGPDLVGLEAVALLGLKAEVVVAVDRSLDEHAVDRIAKNIPRGVRARVTVGLPERAMRPTDSVLIALGFRGGYRFALVPTWVASVVRRYSAVFAGERVLVDPIGHPVSWRRTGLASSSREEGWVTEMIESLFTDVAGARATTAAHRAPARRHSASIQRAEEVVA